MLPRIHMIVTSLICWKNVHSSLTSVEVCCLCQITFANARAQILVYRKKLNSSIISFLLWVNIRLRMATKELFCWGGSFLLKRLRLFLWLTKDEILDNWPNPLHRKPRLVDESTELIFRAS